MGIINNIKGYIMINILTVSVMFSLNPHIVIDGDSQMIRDRQIVDPVVIYVEGDINEMSASKFAEDMREAQSTGQSVIPVVIRSFGGSVYSLFSMVDTIKASKVPVATIVVGKAMSAGAALLSCGTDGMRYAGPHSTIMIHEVSGILTGRTVEIEASADEVTRLNEMMLSIMSKNIGKNEDYFKNIIHSRGHSDWYLTPEEAVSHGIINHIGIPEIEIKITIKTILK